MLRADAKIKVEATGHELEGDDRSGMCEAPGNSSGHAHCSQGRKVSVVRYITGRRHTTS